MLALTTYGLIYLPFAVNSLECINLFVTKSHIIFLYPLVFGSKTTATRQKKGFYYSLSP